MMTDERRQHIIKILGGDWPLARSFIVTYLLGAVRGDRPARRWAWLITRQEWPKEQ